MKNSYRICIFVIFNMIFFVFNDRDSKYALIDVMQSGIFLIGMSLFFICQQLEDNRRG